MNKTILRTKDLKAYYVLDVHGSQTIVKAVNEVDLDIWTNEVYGIAGESGCGKTTLLKALYNAIEPPLRLIGGNIYYCTNEVEVDVTALSYEEKRRLRWEFVSYVPQGSMSVLNPVQKLKDTYQDFIVSHISGKSRKDTNLAKKQANEIARQQIYELGLPSSVLDSYPHQLSGGMRQRVTIALAALLKPRLIICDEPTTALDVVVQRGVVQLLKDIQTKLQNTIVIVTHDMGVQANIADRVGIMYAGKIVEEGSTERIYGNPFHPYTRYLINSLPKFGDKTMRGSVPGSPPSLANLPTGCPFHPRCPHVMDVCVQEMPGYTKVEAAHRVACWLVGEGDNGKGS
jgi:peptide/nickel transport system ATP-binding protein